MSKPFTVIAALLFLLGAAAHAYRLYAGGFTIAVAGYSVPLWASWPAGIVALLFGVTLLVEARR